MTTRETWEWIDSLTTVKSSQRWLLVTLSSYANESGECWPKRQTLADRMGVSVKTVKRGLAKLRRLGLIESAKRKRSNLYRLKVGSIPSSGGQIVPVSVGDKLSPSQVKVSVRSNPPLNPPLAPAPTRSERPRPKTTLIPKARYAKILTEIERLAPVDRKAFYEWYRTQDDVSESRAHAYLRYKTEGPGNDYARPKARSVQSPEAISSQVESLTAVMSPSERTAMLAALEHKHETGGMGKADYALFNRLRSDMALAA